jgi:DNA-binding transcriptional regulator YiaG
MPGAGHHQVVDVELNEADMKLKTPTNEEVRAVRRAANVSQSKAAAMVHLASGSRWSEYERGTRRIDLARWELFLLKTQALREGR